MPWAPSPEMGMCPSCMTGCDDGMRLAEVLAKGPPTLVRDEKEVWPRATGRAAICPGTERGGPLRRQHPPGPPLESWGRCSEGLRVAEAGCARDGQRTNWEEGPSVVLEPGAGVMKVKMQKNLQRRRSLREAPVLDQELCTG